MKENFLRYVEFGIIVSMLMLIIFGVMEAIRVHDIVSGRQTCIIQQDNGTK